MRFLIGMVLGIMASGALMSRPGMQQRLADELGRLTTSLEQFEPVEMPETRVVSRTDPQPELQDDLTTDAIIEEPGETDLDRDAGSETGSAVVEDHQPVSSDSFVAKAPQTSFQLAWSPFRSEASAEGFASQLEARTDHPFVVTKTGVGRYEVGFEFKTAAERERVLAAIDRYTGYLPTQPPTLVER